MPCHLRHHVDMTIGTTTSCSVLIPGPAGQIEVAFDPAEGTPQPLLAVVCHPLPTEGGTMHNKVVTTTARALRETGIATLRFNFRGVVTPMASSTTVKASWMTCVPWSRGQRCSIPTRRCGWRGLALVRGYPCAVRWT